MTYRNDEVIALTKSLVNVKVNAEKDSLLKKEFGVAGYPTIILAKPDGSEIDRIYGYADAETFVTTIDDYLHDRNTLADYLRREKTEPSMKLYAMIGDKYVGRSNFDKAAEYLNRIIEEDPENEQGYSDSALISLGQMKTRAKEYEEAKAIFASFSDKFPASDLADDAMYEWAKTMRYAEQFDDAIAGFKRFIAAYPGSDLTDMAEIYIAYCHDLKGEKDEALRLYNEFLVNHPDSEDTAWVKKKIDKILNPPEEETED